jgi:thiol-disulfide isomerase/thioredoxin
MAQTVPVISPIFSAVSAYPVLDIREQKTIEINLSTKALSVFVFLSPECPVCQGYVKTLNGIQEKYQQKLRVYGIVPGSAYSAKEVDDFEKEYRVGFKLYIDSKQKLTHYLQATVTPQAVLLSNNGTLIYTGAIDNWVQSLGKKRVQVTEHYLQQAIDQNLSASIVKVTRTNAIGCRINDY